jgi:ferric-dicitrate binding protein FerR (iron transport regulator)
VASDLRGRTAWRDGALEFSGAPAATILARLGEWYGTSIRLDDATLGSRPITATMPTDSLDEALEVVALLLGVTVDHHDGQIVLR